MTVMRRAWGWAMVVGGTAVAVAVAVAAVAAQTNMTLSPECGREPAPTATMKA